MRIWLSASHIDEFQVRSKMYEVVMDYQQLLTEAFPGPSWEKAMEKCFAGAHALVTRTAWHAHDSWKGIRNAGRPKTLYFVPVLPFVPEISPERIANVALSLSGVRIGSGGVSAADWKQAKDLGPNASLSCLYPNLSAYTQEAGPQLGPTLEKNIAFLNGMFESSDERFQSVGEVMAALTFGLPVQRGQTIICPKSVLQRGRERFYISLEALATQPHLTMELRLVPAGSRIEAGGPQYLLPTCHDLEYFLGNKRNNT